MKITPPFYVYLVLSFPKITKSYLSSLVRWCGDYRNKVSLIVRHVTNNLILELVKFCTEKYIKKT